MRLTRIFSHEPLEAHAVIALGAAAAGHVSRVLRLQAGDELVLFDGRGGEFSATLLEVRGTTVKARAAERRANERESPLRITLAQGISRGERMDWVVQKATELGVACIVPVLTERSVVRLDDKQAVKKQEHWRGIAIAACEQCGRNRLPDISTPIALTQWLSGAEPAGPKLLLDPDASVSLNQTSRTENLALLIGPEGGLTEVERKTALDRGFIAARLGPRILRTETAAVAAIAVLQAGLGDLR